MKRIPKLSFFVAMSVAAVFAMSCSDDGSPVSWVNWGLQVSNTDYAAQEPFSIAVSRESYSRLNLKAINGRIVITQASAYDSIKISGEKVVESESTKDAKEHLKELQVEVQALTSEIQISTVQPTFSGGRHYVVDYTIRLPKNVDVIVKSLNGPVTLNEILGNVSVKLVNGDIDGDVTLPLDGTIDMSTINGSVELDIPQGTSAKFEATVGNGNISVFNLDFETRTETSKSLLGTCGDGRGAISLNTTNGNITLKGF